VFGVVAAVLVVVVLGLIPMCAGLVALLHSRRLGRALSRYPWVSWPAQYTLIPWGNDNVAGLLFLGADQTQVLGIQGFLWRQRRIKDLSEIWLAGTPEAGGVVSPPGGAFLLWAHRPARRYEHRLMGHRPLNDAGSPRNPDSSDPPK
jgi:hypothetical protein